MVDIVPVTEQWVPDAAAFLGRVAWGSANGDPETYYRWKYLAQPYRPRDGACALVALHSKRVVGHVGMIWERLTDTDGPPAVALSCDFHVDPQYRRKLAALRLAKHLLSIDAPVIAMNAPKAVFDIYALYSPQRAERSLHRYIGMLGLSAVTRGQIDWYRRLPLWAMEWASRIIRSRHTGGWTGARPTEPLPGNLRPALGCMYCRGPEWVRWTCGSPASDTHQFVSSSDGEIDLAAVVRVRGARSRMVELFARNACTVGRREVWSLQRLLASRQAPPLYISHTGTLTFGSIIAAGLVPIGPAKALVARGASGRTYEVATEAPLSGPTEF